MRIIGRAITMALALAAGSFVASGFAGASSGKVSPVVIVRVGILAEIIGIAWAGCRRRSSPRPFPSWRRQSRATPRWRPAGRASAGATCGPASRSAHATCGSGCAT